MAIYGISVYGIGSYGASLPGPAAVSSGIDMRVLPADAISRGLAWRIEDYSFQPILRWGAGRYMAEVLSPDDYSESIFWNQFQMALGMEVEEILRWTQIYSEPVLRSAIDGTNPNALEGILAQWFPQTVSGNRIAFWEDLLGIPTDLGQSESVRRGVIANQMQNRGRSPTVQYMLGIVLKYVNSAIIIDQNALPGGTHDNSFIIQILDPVGIPPTDALLRADIERFKPVTLAYTIKYSETDWVLVGDRDWIAVGDTDWYHG